MRIVILNGTKWNEESQILRGAYPERCEILHCVQNDRKRRARKDIK